MRIAIFSAFYPFRGGIAQFNDRLAKELMKTNEVECFTFKKQYPSFLFPGKTQFDESSEGKIKATQVGNPFQPLTFRKVAKKIQASNPDLLIVNFWMSFFAPLKGFIVKKMHPNILKVALVHNLVPHEERFFDKTLIKFFIKQFDHYVVLSEAVKGDILKIKPKAKVRVLHHPIYDQFGDKLKKSDAENMLHLDSNKKTLLFFGLIRDYKGLDVLIEAFGLLDDTYQLIIAGEVYGHHEKYDELINHSPNKDRIHFHNRFISDKEVTKYFSAADLVVLPYKSATQSGVTAVALHFEIPVLVTNVGGLTEFVKHDITGIVVPGATVEHVQNGIVHYFYDMNSKEMQNEIHKEKEKYSWKSFTRELLEFVEPIDEK